MTSTTIEVLSNLTQIVFITVALSIAFLSWQNIIKISTALAILTTTTVIAVTILGIALINVIASDYQPGDRASFDGVRVAILESKNATVRIRLPDKNITEAVPKEFTLEKLK